MNALDYAINNKLSPFISMQNQHNALYREEEREMMPTIKHFGVGSIPWGPVAAGSESCLLLLFIDRSLKAADL